VITYRDGNLFASGLPAIAHGVNCKGVMGAGIAVQFRTRWPDMFESYRKRCLKGHLLPGETMTWLQPGSPVVFNLATQHDPGACAQPWMITAAVGSMITEAYYFRHLTEVGLPMIGCGFGGLTHADLRSALWPYANAPVNLTVFRLPGAPASGQS
jgi:O-acetyl-ADP-ribose deacetylase (regulator of RNase III)